jgi:hypothetical protein
METATESLMTSYRLAQHFRFFAVLCLLSPLFSTSLHAANSIIPGEYQVTMTKEGKPFHTMKQCFTPENSNFGDAKTGRALIEKTFKEQGCTVKTYNVTGNKVSYSLLCGDTVMTASTTYQQQGFEGDMTSKGPHSSYSVHTSAKRMGACTESGRKNHRRSR